MNNNEKLSVEVLKNGNRIIVEATGTNEPWSLVLKNLDNVEAVENADFILEGNDTNVKIGSGNTKVVIVLK